MFSELGLEDAVKKAILLYNRTRSPESFVKLVFVSPALVRVEFSGTFCYSCGVLGYLEDFAGTVKVLSGKFELKPGKTREISPRSFEADYSVKVKGDS